VVVNVEKSVAAMVVVPETRRPAHKEKIASATNTPTATMRSAMSSSGSADEDVEWQVSLSPVRPPHTQSSKFLDGMREHDPARIQLATVMTTMRFVLLPCAACVRELC